MLFGVPSFAATTYWLDDHSWTTDVTTISYWKDYKSKSSYVLTLENKCESASLIVMNYKNSYPTNLYLAFKNSVGAVMTGVYAFKSQDPEAIASTVLSAQDAANNVYAIVTANANANIAMKNYDIALDNRLSAVKAVDSQYKKVWYYNYKWGTIHYSP